VEQGKIMEAEVPTVRVGATPTGLTAPTTPQDFSQAGYPSCRPTNSVKALKANNNNNETKIIIIIFRFISSHMVTTSESSVCSG